MNRQQDSQYSLWQFLVMLVATDLALSFLWYVGWFYKDTRPKFTKRLHCSGRWRGAMWQQIIRVLSRIPLNYDVHHSLKRNCHHFDEIFATVCTWNCQRDNFQSYQWRKCLLHFPFCPADTLRNNDVVIISKQRHFDVIAWNEVVLTL